MLARLILFAAAAAIGSGVVLGRRAVNRNIEERVPAEIEVAKVQAEAELHKEISQVIVERLISFATGLLIKAGIIGGVYLLFTQGFLSAFGLKICVALLIATFVIYDLTKTLPFFVPAFRQVRRHGWNMRTALSEFIAGVAFERAYARAMLAAETGSNRVFIALSKYSAKSISEEVGAAVADVARNVSVKRARSRALMAVLIAALMSTAYFGFFWLTIGAVAK